VERDFYGRVNSHRFAVLQAGLEEPLLDRFDRFLIESQTQRLGDFRVARMAVLVNDDLQCYSTLLLRLAGFFGIFRLDFVKDRRLRNSAADAINASAKSAAGSRTSARAFA